MTFLLTVNIQQCWSLDVLSLCSLARGSHRSAAGHRAGANFPLRQDRLFTAREAHVACQREFASYPRRAAADRGNGCDGRAAETGQHVGKRAASAGRSSLSASCCPASWQTTRKPSGSERKSEPPRKQSTEPSSLKREQLGGFCRAKEEFNGVDVVVSYLINKGDNYENHDNSTSNCADPPEYVRPCARWDEHGKSRHPPLQHGRCGRSYCNQT